MAAKTCPNTYFNLPEYIPAQTYVLNRQTHEEYHLTNLTRCAAIYNYIHANHAINASVNEIFQVFVDTENPAAIPKVFIDNFEVFFRLYLMARFGRMFNILIRENGQTMNNFPVNVFVNKDTIVAIYSRDKLSQFMNNVSTFQYLFFNEKFFLMPKRGHKPSLNIGNSLTTTDNSDRSTQIDNVIEQMRQRDVEISPTTAFETGMGSSAGIDIHHRNRSFIDDFTLAHQAAAQRASTCPSTLPPMADGNHAPTIADMPFTPVMKCQTPIINNRCGVLDNPLAAFNVDEQLQVQTNFAAIWHTDHHVPLTFLTTICHMLEVAVRPILCALMQQQVDNMAAMCPKPGGTPPTVVNLSAEFENNLSHVITIDLKTCQHPKSSVASMYRY